MRGQYRFFYILVLEIFNFIKLIKRTFLDKLILESKNKDEIVYFFHLVNIIRIIILST